MFNPNKISFHTKSENCRYLPFPSPSPSDDDDLHLSVVCFVGFPVGLITVLCIGNYYRAKRAQERQRTRRLAKLARSASNDGRSTRSNATGNSVSRLDQSYVAPNGGDAIVPSGGMYDTMMSGDTDDKDYSAMFLRKPLEIEDTDDIIMNIHDECKSKKFSEYCEDRGFGEAQFCPNTHLIDANNIKRQEFLQSIASEETPHLAVVFHGTHSSNIQSILKDGLDKDKRLLQAYGPGEYFSTEPGPSLSYCKGGLEMLVFAVVLPTVSVKERCPSDYVVVNNNCHHFPLGVLRFTSVDQTVRSRSDTRRTLCEEVTSESQIKEETEFKAIIREKLIANDIETASRIFEYKKFLLLNTDQRISKYTTSLLRNIDQRNIVNDILRGVVLVGLWDIEKARILEFGSGFIADKKRGLILTAGHIFYDILSKKIEEKHKGRKTKAIIGTLCKTDANDNTARFTNFAEIITHDIENMDAVVLHITTKIKKSFITLPSQRPVDEPMTRDSLKDQNMMCLKLRKKPRLNEKITIVGFNQSGEDRHDAGQYLNHAVSTARGYICETRHEEQPLCDVGESTFFRTTKSEIIVEDCSADVGHSGGPCVDQDNMVIGIVSRKHSKNDRRCFLVPAYKLKKMLKRAKKLVDRRFRA